MPLCGTALRRTPPPAGPRPAGGPRRPDPRQAGDGLPRAATPTPRCSPRSATGTSTSAGARARPATSAPPSRCATRSASGCWTAGSTPSCADATPSESPTAARRAGRHVRAYIGVPFKTADARAYVLCCLAHEARPDLGEADVRFLQGVAESLRPLLGREAVKLARSSSSPLAAAGCGRGSSAAPRRAPRRRAPAEGRLLRRAGVRHRAAAATQPRVFVVEQGGTIRSSRAARRSTRRSWTSRDKITSGGEQGLLSMAFAPDYATQRALLRLLHGQERRRAGRRVQARDRRRAPTPARPATCC